MQISSNLLMIECISYNFRQMDKLQTFPSTSEVVYGMWQQIVYNIEKRDRETFSISIDILSTQHLSLCINIPYQLMVYYIFQNNIYQIIATWINSQTGLPSVFIFCRLLFISLFQAIGTNKNSLS